MARGAAQAQRKRQAQPQPKRKQKRAAPSWEEQLFFSRLRRHAKVMYVLLALAFAIGFVAFGVGSGSTGISDILRGNFFGGGGSSTSSRIKDQQKQIQRHPNDVEGYLTLATFYQQDNNDPAAVATLEKAARIKPKNLDVLNALARIYRGKAETAQNSWATAENSLAESNLAPPGLDPSTTLGQALTSDPLSQSLKNQASDSFVKMSTAFSKAEDAYKRVAAAARGTSHEADAQLQLASVAIEAVQVVGLSGQTRDAQVAINAYKRYLQLEPKGVSANQARQTLKQLQALVPQSHR
jgi:tetratricopeptide (TPR) repeat protein